MAEEQAGQEGDKHAPQPTKPAFCRRTDRRHAGRGRVDGREFGLRQLVHQSLARHLGGDWGDLGSEDKASNEDALKKETRILSAYNDDRFPKNGIATIWIITEADRSATTILFPDEY